jgi:hypothetical protein
MSHAPHYLRFARAIALVSGIATPVVAMVACTAGTGPPAGVDSGPEPGPVMGVVAQPEGPDADHPTGVADIPDSSPHLDSAIGVYEGGPVGVAPSDSGPGGGGPQATPELPESWA